MPIDEILKSIRKELGISQEALARDLNVSFAALNRWENKKSKPSRMAMMLIKDYCKQKDISVQITGELDKIRV